MSNIQPTYGTQEAQRLLQQCVHTTDGAAFIALMEVVKSERDLYHPFNYSHLMGECQAAHTKIMQAKHDELTKLMQSPRNPAESYPHGVIYL